MFKLLSQKLFRQGEGAQSHKSSDEHEHTWVFLLPGYQVCLTCGAIQKSGMRRRSRKAES